MTGATRLAPAETAALVAPFAPGCMQGADVQAAMRALDAAYADRGLITSKTYIPAQNLSDRVLTLEVVEGRIEGLFLIGPEGEISGRRADRLLGTAFPGAEGALFDLRDFEQGLDQMNRLASVEATLRLQPGEEPGGSYAIVERAQADRLRGSARADTLASRATGRNRLTLQLEADDLLGANDAWTASFAVTENTNALSLGASVPYGRWTFEGDLGVSEYLTPLSPLAELFGTTTTARLSARRMLRRGQFSTTEGHATLDWRDGARLVNNAALTPQRVTALTLGLRHIRLGEGSRNSFEAGISFGLPLLGATRDEADAPRDAPSAQFSRLSFGWQRQAALGTLGTLVTDLQAQASPDTLFGSEQMALGSYATVRGYDAAIVAGDGGGYLRTDLYLAPDLWTRALPAGLREAAARRVQPHLFLDAGVVRDRAGGADGRAGGAGFGLSWQRGRVTATGLVGVPLVREGGRLGTGNPVAQVRFDVVAF